MDFGKRVKQLREERELTQYELAEKLQVPRSNISKYESGQLEANFMVLKTMANYFNVTIDYLLGNDEMKRENPHEYIPVLQKAKKHKISPAKLNKLIDCLKDDN